MKEFMLLIRSQENDFKSLSPEQQQQHMQKVMAYMGGLMKSGKLKSAQPLDLSGVIISGPKGKIKDGPYNESKEVIAGYFIIQAKDMDEAIQIANGNPILEDIVSSRIEVRPIKALEGFN